MAYENEARRRLQRSWFLYRRPKRAKRIRRRGFAPQLVFMPGGIASATGAAAVRPPPGPAFLAGDYVQALRGLMPRGRVWPRDLDAVQSKALAGLAPLYERQTTRANALVTDIFPAASYELLPEWEATLGLPDPCAGAATTIEARRGQVVARFTDGGGQSPQHYIDFAAALGFAITIMQFAPYRFGMPMHRPMCGDAWASTWQINAPLFTVDYFQFGVSGFGEPFASWSNAVLECEIKRLKPAHTLLLFAYH